MTACTRVIGVGNPERGDDGVGRLVIEHMRAAGLADIEILGCDGEAAELIEMMDGAERVFLVDAALSGAELGTIRRIDVTRDPLPAQAERASTHGLGLGEAIALARALGRLPRHCIVYAIEAERFDPGAPPSLDVRRAAVEAARRIRAELAG